MVPEGWYRTKLGKVLKSRRERGQGGLPTISVTLNNGLVLRESLDRKTDTTLSPEEHLLVRKGDIAYNMMRMWQGASGLARFDALVSPAYVVLTPTKDIDPVFASYLFKSARMVYLLWAFSYGITSDRLRLYFADFSLIPVTLPPIKEQRRIGDLLTAWDRAIEVVERLVQNSEAQKKAIMQQLLTGKRRLEHHKHRQWRRVRLQDIAEIVTSNVDKKSDPTQSNVRLCNYTDVYYHTHITGSIQFMEATATQSEIDKFSLRKGDVLITKDSETPDDIAVPALVDEDLSNVLCGYHLALIRARPGEADGGFLSGLFSLKHTQHYFLTRANGATRFGLTVDAIKQAQFWMPQIEEQRDIARLLRDCERNIENQRNQLMRLEQEKKGLMQVLISGRRRVRVDASGPVAAIG